MTNYGNGYKFRALNQRRRDQLNAARKWDIYCIKKNGERYANPLDSRYMCNDPEKELARLQELNPGRQYEIVYR